VVPLAFEDWRRHGLCWHPRAPALLGATAGLLGYMGYLQAVGKGAFDFMKAEGLGWGRITVTSWRSLHAALSVLYHNPMHSLAFTYTFIELASAVRPGVGCLVIVGLGDRWSDVV